LKKSAIVTSGLSINGHRFVLKLRNIHHLGGRSRASGPAHRIGVLGIGVRKMMIKLALLTAIYCVIMLFPRLLSRRATPDAASAANAATISAVIVSAR
jgi:hypothetical protein